MDLSDVRREYEAQGIRKKDMDADPFTQFGRWLQRARELQLLDATAMTLATVASDGKPSARIVLLKHVDNDGFCWFTDSRSQKGCELAANPNAALLFYWRDLSRQVRVQGEARLLPAGVAEDYFHRRPEGSRFSAAASHQSAPVARREDLEDEVNRLRADFRETEIPRPDPWLGYCLQPAVFEFWQGQDNRLHDRIVYRRDDTDAWVMSRISP